MVRCFSENGNTPVTIRRFQAEYPGRAAPSRSTILRNVEKYSAHGTSANRNQGHSGRPRNARTPGNIAAVRRSLIGNPEVSSRRNNMPNLSKSSFNRITHKEHPKASCLAERDHQRRLNYCNWLVNRHHRFPLDIIIGDEACFHMNGQVNIWNTRKYGQDRNAARDFVHDISNDMRKVNVWVGLAGDNIILGPIFLINQQVVPQLHQRYGRLQNGAIRRKWWFQDGAPAHRSVIVRNRLQELFPNRVVGLGHQLEWPPRSPDLTPLGLLETKSVPNSPS